MNRDEWKKSKSPSDVPTLTRETNEIINKVKFEAYGEEMLEKKVRQSGNSGRVYLPPEWIGKHVKIIRIN